MFSGVGLGGRGDVVSITKQASSQTQYTFCSTVTSSVKWMFIIIVIIQCKRCEHNWIISQAQGIDTISHVDNPTNRLHEYSPIVDIHKQL